MKGFCYKKEELLKSLPKLPKTGVKKLPDHVIIGLSSSSSMRERFVMIKRTRGGGYGPNPNFDLRKANAFRRRVFAFDESKMGFMKVLNTELKGGERYPVLLGVLGIAASVYSLGVGTVFALLTMAVAPGGDGAPVLARQGDEIWHLECLGHEDGKIRHSEQLLLVDPFRKSAGHERAVWLIHEDRQDLTMP